MITRKRPRSEQASPSTWCCSVCTLQNPLRRNRCGACDERRPLADSTNSISVKSKVGSWILQRKRNKRSVPGQQQNCDAIPVGKPFKVRLCVNGELEKETLVAMVLDPKLQAEIDVSEVTNFTEPAILLDRCHIRIEQESTDAFENVPCHPLDMPDPLPTVAFRTAGKSSLISVSDENIAKARKLLSEPRPVNGTTVQSMSVVGHCTKIPKSDNHVDPVANAYRFGKTETGAIGSDDVMVKAAACINHDSDCDLTEHRPERTPPSPQMSSVSFTTAGKGIELVVSEHAMLRACNLLDTSNEHTVKKDLRNVKERRKDSTTPLRKLSTLGRAGLKTRKRTQNCVALLDVKPQPCNQAHVMPPKVGQKLYEAPLFASKVDVVTPTSDLDNDDSFRIHKVDSQNTYDTTSTQCISFVSAGTGLKISVTAEAIASATKLLSSDRKQSVAEQRSMSVNEGERFTYFSQMANESNVSELAIVNAKKSLDKPHLKSSLIQSPEGSSQIPVSFATAGKGIAVQISKEAWNKAIKILEGGNVLSVLSDCPVDGDVTEWSTSPPTIEDVTKKGQEQNDMLTTRNARESMTVAGAATPKGATLKVAVAVTRSANVKNPYQRQRMCENDDWSPVSIAFNKYERTEESNSPLILIDSTPSDTQKTGTGDENEESTSPMGDLLQHKKSRSSIWTKCVEDCIADGVNPLVAEIDAMNATELRFDADNGYPSNLGGYPNSSGKRTFGDLNDLRDALVQLGCDENSITDKWLANHTRWVVWKLASIERRFSSSVAGEYCTFDRLVSRLKARHEQEIQGGQRSALRKVLNRDVSSCCMMILCVSHVLLSPKQESILPDEKVLNSSQETRHRPGCKLELTDGWYGVQAVLDPHLSDLVDSGRIVVGTKLLIGNAILKGADDGIDPLDDMYTSTKSTSNTGLGLFANSTRLARWDAKLGFVRPSKRQRENRGVLMIRALSDVVIGGGNIPLIDLVVCRVFPRLYYEKTGKPDVGERCPPILTVSEEHDRNDEFEKKKQKAMDVMSETIQRDCAKDIDEMAPDLWKALLKSASPENFYEHLGKSEKVSIDKWKEQRTVFLFDRVRKAMSSELELDASMLRESTPFIRVFVKSLTPGSSLCNGATLTLWNHTEEQLALLNEGTPIRIQNLSVKGSTYEGMLQLTGGVNTVMGPSPGAAKYAKLPGYTPRCFTNLAGVCAMSKKLKTRRNPAEINPYVDVAGVVLRVELEKHQHSVYLTDESGLVVCIIRTGELKETDPLKGLGPNAEQNLEYPHIVSFRDLRVLPYDRVGSFSVVMWTSFSSIFTKHNPRVSTLQCWAVYSTLLRQTAAYLDVGLAMIPQAQDHGEYAIGYIIGFQPQRGSQMIKIQVDCHNLSEVQVWDLPFFLVRDTIALVRCASGSHSLKLEEETRYAKLKVLGSLLGGRGVLLRFDLQRIGDGYQVRHVAAANVHALANVYFSLNEANV